MSQTSSASIVLTGFGPFPGIAENVTARLVPAIADRARRRWPAVTIVDAILPTEWAVAPERIRALYAAHRPVLMLHFGVASDAAGFRIETEAANACRAAPDAAGLLPLATQLRADCAATLPATIPVARIHAHLTAAGYPTSLSDDAGGYLCNAVLYHALDVHQSSAAEKDVVTRAACRVGFIHVPPTLEGPPLDFEMAVSGALEILTLCMAERA
ncbi:MAG: pyroglutamyl-peptidase I [Hyphomicrobium sp.]